jgi:hypothetical protein
MFYYPTLIYISSSALLSKIDTGISYDRVEKSISLHYMFSHIRVLEALKTDLG